MHVGSMVPVFPASCDAAVCRACLPAQRAGLPPVVQRACYEDQRVPSHNIAIVQVGEVHNIAVLQARVLLGTFDSLRLQRGFQCY